VVTTDNPLEAQEKPSWISDLLNRRFGQSQDPRIKRKPIGFDFTREPFDPSSYYRAIGTFRDISRAATQVTRQEVYNREEAERQRQIDLAGPLQGVNPNFTYDDGHDHGHSGESRKYGLKRVTANVAGAADYFGSKYGIKSVGGWRSKGSVPGSDHPKGRALDFMTSNVKTGTALAHDLIRNAKKWSVTYVIWNRYIWTPGRGWRKYSGPSPHTDHVHASFSK
jgi:hypothetical protein